jgi:hypothetical protein
VETKLRGETATIDLESQKIVVHGDFCIYLMHISDKPNKADKLIAQLQMNTAFIHGLPGDKFIEYDMN